jgi:Ferritin-like domain
VQSIHGTTRAQFLRRGATGGLALVAGGSLLATTAGPALAAGSDPSDVDIATLAASAELLAVDFYTRCVDSGVFGGRRERYLSGARSNEQDHYNALAKLIGADAPKNLKFQYPAGTFASRENASNTGIALETAFIGAYLGAIRALDDPNLKVVAGQICANEFGPLHRVHGHPHRPPGRAVVPRPGADRRRRRRGARAVHRRLNRRRHAVGRGAQPCPTATPTAATSTPPSVTCTSELASDTLRNRLRTSAITTSSQLTTT